MAIITKIKNIYFNISSETNFNQNWLEYTLDGRLL